MQKLLVLKTALVELRLPPTFRSLSSIITLPVELGACEAQYQHDGCPAHCWRRYHRFRLRQTSGELFSKVTWWFPHDEFRSNPNFSSQIDSNQPLQFSQVFSLMPVQGTAGFFVLNDVFRLVYC